MNDKNETIVSEAITRIKDEIPDLCMWVYTARDINEKSNTPDTYNNTTNTMQLIIDMLISEKNENIKPSLTQRRGWDTAIVSKRNDVDTVINDTKTMEQNVTDVIKQLNDTCIELSKARELVELKYKDTITQLEDIIDSVVNNEYKGPGEVDVMITKLYDGIKGENDIKRNKQKIKENKLIVKKLKHHVNNEVDTDYSDSEDSDTISTDSSDDSDDSESSYESDDPIQVPVYRNNNYRYNNINNNSRRQLRDRRMYNNSSYNMSQ